MKLLFTTVSLFLFYTSFSQTITTSSLPKSGSEHTYYTVLNPDYEELSRTGDFQIWNLFDVSGGISKTIKYEDPSLGEYGDLYPEASFFVSEGVGNEVYYKSDDTGMKIIGSPTPSFIDPEIIEKGAFSPPLYLIKTPMQKDQAVNQTTGFAINIPLSIIPDSILNTLPITPDSLRILFTASYNYVTSGAGTLMLPGKNFNVLQQIGEATTSAMPQAKIPFLGWIDISEFFDFGLDGEETTQVITFWSPNEEGYVARFEYNEALGQFIDAEYTANGTILKNSETVLPGNAQIYPNPVSDLLYFTNLPLNGDLKISISDSRGYNIVTNYDSNKGPMDVSKIPSGIYYVKFESEGQLVGVKKFIKI